MPVTVHVAPALLAALLGTNQRSPTASPRCSARPRSSRRRTCRSIRVGRSMAADQSALYTQWLGHAGEDLFGAADLLRAPTPRSVTAVTTAI